MKEGLKVPEGADRRTLRPSCRAVGGHTVPPKRHVETNLVRRRHEEPSAATLGVTNPITARRRRTEMATGE
jgi:hypothetical protein